MRCIYGLEEVADKGVASFEACLFERLFAEQGGEVLGSLLHVAVVAHEQVPDAHRQLARHHRHRKVAVLAHGQFPAPSVQGAATLRQRVVRALRILIMPEIEPNLLRLRFLGMPMGMLAYRPDGPATFWQASGLDSHCK
jgi:hypothetical protein